METATDFHNALVAAVDEIDHTPGFRADGNDTASFAKSLSRYEISDGDARLAARQGTIVVTTLGEAIDWTFDGKENADDRRAVREMIARNLKVLRKYGVSIAIGSDNFGATSAPEALSLSRLQVFDNSTRLKLWCEDTVATIFPGRKVGHLKEEYEASFLVLGENPVTDFANVQKIERRFKQGEFLTFPP